MRLIRCIKVFNVGEWMIVVNKIVFIFFGGGIWLLVYIGILKVLSDFDVEFFLLVGIFGGFIVVVFYSYGMLN